MQTKNATTLKALKDVYSLNYNIGYLQESFSLLKPYCDSFFDFFNKHESDIRNKSILDVGCGYGNKAIAIAFKSEASIVIGVDGSKVAIKCASFFQKELKLKNLRFINYIF